MKQATKTIRVTVRAKPRARRSRVLLASGLRIEVSVAAAPVNGAANAELLRVLAEALGVGRSDLQIALGAGARLKVVEVVGLDETEAVRRLAEAADRRR